MASRQTQAGFTLVELAIVMIIIGLLIAGVLKGQALIANAQVTATVAQLKAIDAATTTFKDTYNSIPGDIVNPTTVVPNCAVATACGATPGDGNGRLNNTPAVTPASTEGSAFFPQLNAAGLVTGIVPGAANSVVTGANYPAAKISNNAIQPGSSQAGALADFPGTFLPAAPVAAGLYLTITQVPGVPTVGLTPDQALRIDTKLDDGVPDTGVVLASGATGLAATNCGSKTAGAVPGQYATIATTPTCILHYRFQS